MDPIFSTVSTCLHKVLAREVPIEPETSIISDLGLDSLQMIEFLLTVEDTLQVELDFESMDMDYLQSVDAFCRFVSSRG
ncbi:acyl carrier protein [Streptomyces sp. NPDC051740]|uniref:acyl carrier protein n=1 Tax=Streptomyces sp. NPDC051740 TaxID=3365673 RepID=UPI00378C33AC